MGRNLPLRVGAILTGLFIASGLLALVWTPYDVALVDVGQRLLPPSAAHLLGTDPLGRDVLSLVLAGATNSLSVSLLGVGVGLALGVPLGLLAAARGGWADDLLMRTGDLVFAFPWLMTAILLAAILGPGATNAVLAIAILTVPIFARLTRGEGRRLWHRDFVAAARLAGKGRLSISVQHILPNIAGPLIVQATIQFAMALLAEAGLSYVGLGVQPPAPSWGRMLAEAQTLAGTAPWLAIVPGTAILLSVFGLTLAGDGLGRHITRGDKR